VADGGVDDAPGAIEMRVAAVERKGSSDSLCRDQPGRARGWPRHLVIGRPPDGPGRPWPARRLELGSTPPGRRWAGGGALVLENVVFVAADEHQLIRCRELGTAEPRAAEQCAYRQRIVSVC
jgi:hypothetical protein